MLFGVFGDKNARRPNLRQMLLVRRRSSAAASAISSSASRPSATGPGCASSAWPLRRRARQALAARSACSSATGSISCWSAASAARRGSAFNLLARCSPAAWVGCSWAWPSACSEGIAARSLGKFSYGTARRHPRRLRRRLLFGLVYLVTLEQRASTASPGRAGPGHHRRLHRLAVGPGAGRLPAGLGQGACAAGRRAANIPRQGRQPARPRRARRHRPVPRHEGRKTPRLIFAGWATAICW